MSQFKVIDSFLLTPQGFLLKKYHLQRTLYSFNQLKIPVNEFQISQLYQKIDQMTLNLENRFKGRITIDPMESILNTEIQLLPLDQQILPVSLALAKKPLTDSEKFFHQFKTTKREYWDTEIQQSHLLDVIGYNQNNELTDTSRFNLFLKKDHLFLTPPLSSGCLNGVFRRYLLEHQKDPFLGNPLNVIEKTLRTEDINNSEIYVGNSVRGLLPARIY